MTVDCVLPLPLEGTFSYNVPAHLCDCVRVGCRVNVPFGRSKQYAALVLEVHVGDDGGYDGALKDIIGVLDVCPMLLPTQLRLWRWVADYYMCSLGEVYKAAVPSMLKVEDGVCRYRPKVVECVRLRREAFDAVGLNLVIGGMRSAPKQQLALLKYVELAGVNAALKVDNIGVLREMTCEELMRAAGCTRGVLRALCERGVLEVYERRVERIPTGNIPSEMVMHELSEAQRVCMERIVEVLRGKDVCLLHGVTGSGKTEVYVHLIHDALMRGEQVLFLLPEIVLTSQLTERLRRVFGDRLGVYHSKYSDAERVEVYQKQVSDCPYDIIVGVRSSVLLPFQRLGLVIVDEEHETSFKQSEPAPRYQGRNVALMLARLSGAKTVLGTATPSLESYHNCMVGKYGLVELRSRFGNALLPEIRVVDIGDLKRRRLMRGPFSGALLAEMRGALERGEQVILFQNRRGFAPVMECGVCGWVPHCPSCDVSLTYHKRLDQMVCHYCGFSTPVVARCPQCDADALGGKGYGTERIEDLLAEVLPGARVERMDLDTTRSRRAYEGIIRRFQRGETDVLIGTQMVTKGLDFRRVTVVGILNASTMLSVPDFRSYERAFQMMTQVAGRAGRSAGNGDARRGVVILQVHDAKSPTVGQVVRGDYVGMYREQMEERREFVYPPLCRLVYVYMKHRDETVLDHLAGEMASYLRRVFGNRVLGPDLPPIARIQGLYIRKVCLKIELAGDMAEARRRLREIRGFLLERAAYRSAIVYYDVD